MIPNKNSLKSIIMLSFGLIFLLFSNGRWFFPLAAWLYPSFILYFTRKNKPLAGYLTIVLLSAICNQISFWKFSSSNPYSPLFYLPALLGIMISIPFLIVRLFYGKLKEFKSTLIFPLAYTSIDFIYGSLSPMGSTGVLGYSQYSFLSLVQLVSITGIWGLTFVITWFASLTNWVTENVHDVKNIKRPLILYISIMMTILLYGSIRLIIPDSQSTVRVSGLHVYDLRETEGKELWNASENDWKKFRQICIGIQNRLFELTIKKADSGSKIIVWGEISPPVAAEDEEAFIDRAEKTALDKKIYLVVSPFVDHKNSEEQDENKLMIFDPAGKLVLTHYKFGGNFIENTVKGDKLLHTAKTPYGILSGVICWDQDFPEIMRQAGRNKVDILAAPTADWKEIDPLHTAVGYFRSVENGYSLIRESVNGLSIISDSKGRILSSMDHFTSSEWVMTAEVPIKGSFTLYSILGNWFGWLSLVCLLVLISSSTYPFRKFVNKIIISK
jgi:apolipoprotein N-acyltransferase